MTAGDEGRAFGLNKPLSPGAAIERQRLVERSIALRRICDRIDAMLKSEAQ
jgi:hypothetical protein